MAKTEPNPSVAMEVPWSDSLTDYDKRHLVTYLRLLDADAEGASEAKMAKLILGLDMEKAPDRASRTLKAHLGRARWMSDKGALDLLK